MPKNKWPAHLQPVHDLPPPEVQPQALPEVQPGTPAAANGKSAPVAHRVNLDALMKAQQDYVSQGTVDLRGARDACHTEFQRLLKEQGFESAFDGISAIEKSAKAGPLPEALQQLKNAQESLHTAEAALRTKSDELEKLFSKSGEAVALRTKAAKEMETHAASTIRAAPAPQEPGFWVRTLDNVKENLFSKERGGATLATNWISTGVGAFMVFKGAEMFLAAPPKVLVQDNEGQIHAEEGKKTLGDITWALVMLGSGALGVYWGAIGKQQGRGFF